MTSKDLTGRRFGRLTAIERVPDPDARRPMWWCQCDCGNETTVMSTDLTMGCVKSCGCLQHEVSSKNIKKALDAVKSDYVDGTYIKRIQSTGTSKANKSGITGVSWDKSRNKLVAQIMFKGRAISLGRFDKFDDAVAARKAAEDLYFKPIIEKVQKIKNRPGHPGLLLYLFSICAFRLSMTASCSASRSACVIA